MDAIIKDRHHAHRSSVLRKRRPEECAEQRQDLPTGPWPSKPETVAKASDVSPPFAFHEMKRELAETERKEKVTAWNMKAEKRKMLMDSDKNEVLKRIKILLTVVERGKVLESFYMCSKITSPREDLAVHLPTNAVNVATNGTLNMDEEHYPARPSNRAIIE